MNKSLWSIIIPTYNSGRDLPIALIDADKFLREAGFEYEIIVADAKSADQTADIVRRFSALIKNLELVVGDTAGNFGKALKNGVQASSGEVCVFIDPIAAWPKETFLKMFSALMDEKLRDCDVIIGKRALNRNKRFSLRCSFAAARMAAKSLLSVEERDLFSGIWGFRRECAAAVFPKMRLSGAGADWESVILAGRLGFKVKEVSLPENVGKPFSRKVLWENLGPMMRVGYGLRRDIYHLQNKNN
jgi:glycosyltransferase involved in cell wall biosynthesis